MKLLFAQALVVLCSKAPDLGVLRMLLERHGETIGSLEDGSADWPEMEGPSLKLPWKSGGEATGMVDIVSTRWPDNLGSTGEPDRVTHAHILGGYGPAVHPGCLERAAAARQQPEFVELMEGHAAFIRLRITSGLLAADDSATEDTAAPTEDPAEELRWLLGLATVLGDLPQALAYFDPSGEVLMPFSELKDMLDENTQAGTFPVQAVVTVRAYRMEEDWALADTVGMGQFGLSDHELAVPPGGGLQPGDMRMFLLNLAHYQIHHRAIIQDNHTTDGPDGRLLRAEERKQSCTIPPRAVLHWTGNDAPQEPPTLARRDDDVPDEAAPTLDDIEAQASRQIDEAIHRFASVAETTLQDIDAIRERAGRWIASPAFLATFYDDTHPPPVLKTLLEQEMKSQARDVWRNAQVHGIQSPELWAQYQQLAQGGRVMLASGIIVNPAFTSEPDHSLPCLLVVSEDQTPKLVSLCTTLAEICATLYRTSKAEDQFPKLTKLMRDDEFQLFRRRPVPPEENHGQRCTLLDIQLRKAWMPPEDFPYIPLLMLPGPRGAVVQIPWHVFAGTPPPMTPAKPGRWAELAALDRHAGHLAAAQAPARGRTHWFTWVLAAILVFGLVGGIWQQITGPPPSPKPTFRKSFEEWRETRKSAANEKKTGKTEEVPMDPPAQSPALHAKFKTVPASEYQPLTRTDAKGAGFVFRQGQDMIMAVTSRVVNSALTRSPQKLSGPDGTTVTLSMVVDIPQRGLLLQFVRDVDKPSTCLDYSIFDKVVNDDPLQVILPGGKRLEGKAVSGAPGELKSGFARMTVKLQTPLDITGHEGCPVVHAGTGRVIGMLQAISPQGEAGIIVVDTIMMPLLKAK